jgi:DNA polymerase-3 subunit epsilon
MRPIFYDTETTGLKPQKDRVIELAAYDPVENRVFETFINPQMPIPPEQTAIHHITDDMVKDAPTFGEVALDFTKFCEGDTVLIAHNNDAFDILFMKAEYERAQVPFPAWKILCSLKWARRYRPDLPTHRLQVLRELFGIQANQAHRALDDVKVLCEVFSNLIGDLHISEVYNLMMKPRLLQHMPFGKHQGKLLKELPKDYVDWLKGSGAFDKTENNELKQSLAALNMF